MPSPADLTVTLHGFAVIAAWATPTVIAGLLIGLVLGGTDE